ncbi:RnaseH-domain-containing protein [Cerioporus squamosus]|nr:RnaseH-domain-containing protein [Cerioporus squamosus]
MFAVGLAVVSVPPFAPLHIVTDSKYVLKGLTVHRHVWEAQGWFGLSNAGLIRDTIARLRVTAPTTLRWVKGHSGVQGNEGADALAKAAFVASGAQLVAVTQKLAYKFIRKGRQVDCRLTTRRNMDLAQCVIKEIAGNRPTDAMIWAEMWKLETDRPIRVFWWKMLHGAYKMGPYWLNIPACVDRALCKYCGALESMEHVLCVCNSPWRVALWTDVCALLANVGLKTDDLSFAHLLAVSVLALPGRSATVAPACVRLSRIILTEMVYLTWVVRCEWTIGREGNLARLPTVSEIINRWYWRLNRHLWIDVVLATKTKRRCIVPKCLVLETWRGLISCAGEVPDDWMSASEVLVGRASEVNRRGVG